MSKVLVTESHLNNIAEAIRSKNGAATTYRPGDMATAIEALDTSGIHPTGTKNIAQNGTHDVTQYASANVNVQPNLQSKTATQNGTVTPDQGYDGLSSVVVNVSGGGGGGGDDPSIPAEYQQVAYLGFTGTQFILASVSMQQYQVVGVKALIGAEASNNEQDIVGFDNAESIYFQNGYVTRYGNNFLYFPVTPQNMLVTKGTEFAYCAAYNATDSKTLIIGRYKSSGSNPHPIENGGRVYEVKIMQANTPDLTFSNVYWFVPCVRKSDNVAGFYEAINGIFYINQGTGDFVVGTNV